MYAATLQYRTHRPGDYSRGENQQLYPYLRNRSAIFKYNHLCACTLQNLAGMGSNSTLQIKTISAAHATATSVAALLLLRYTSWNVSPSNEPLTEPSPQHDQRLDDSRNPTINGQNRLANALTAWETAYLLYDTYAVIHASRRKNGLRSNTAALRQVLKESPIVMAHHVLLSSAFLVLQSYILSGKEKGLWVITAFMLMNSSTPLMHARWWRRQKTGKSSTILDMAFLTTFAASRFGVTIWILYTYGRYHNMGPWQAYRMLRMRCQIGTGLLVGLNGIWWIILCGNILKRNLRK